MLRSKIMHMLIAIALSLSTPSWADNQLCASDSEVTDLARFFDGALSTVVRLRQCRAYSALAAKAQEVENAYATTYNPQYVQIVQRIAVVYERAYPGRGEEVLRNDIMRFIGRIERSSMYSEDQCRSYIVGVELLTKANDLEAATPVQSLDIPQYRAAIPYCR